MDKDLIKYFEKILCKKYGIERDMLSVESYHNFGHYYNYYERKMYNDIFQYSVNWLCIDSVSSMRQDELLLNKNEYLIYLRKQKLEKIDENR